MRLVKDAGGSYVFCDTDSLFIAASLDGGPIVTGVGRAIDTLTPSEIDAIVARFESLNPYSTPETAGSILQLEDENFDPETGERRLIDTIAIASKRYVMYTIGSDGRPHIVGHSDKRKRSEHGLGHLLSPTDPDSEETWWIDRWWEHAVCWVLGLHDPEPEWFSAPAIGRVTVTSQHEEATFARFNEGREYGERVRPWNFLMMAHPDWTSVPERGDGCLVAPYRKDPESRRDAEWLVRGGDANRLEIRTGNREYVVSGTVVVKSYGQYFEEYLLHVDAKMAADDGSSARPWTRGSLGPIEVRAAPVLQRVGKESRSAIEQPEQRDRGVYYRTGACLGCGRPVPMRKEWCSDACRKRAGRTKAVYECRGCEEVLRSTRQRWCSDSCRKRASRATSTSLVT